MAERSFPLRPHLEIAAAALRSQMAYRLSFGLQVLGNLTLTGLDFLAVLVIFSHLPTLGGWSLMEVLLLYGIAGVCFAVCDLAVGSLDLLPRMIRDGSFDLVLTRPLGSLFQVVAAEFAFRRLGKVAQATTILVVALTQLPIHWTPGRALVLAVTFVSGPLIFGSIWVIGATATFWTVDTMEMTNAFTYGGNLLTSYPINIFEGWLRRLLAFVVPLAFVSYYPALFILGKPDPLHGPAYLPFLAVPVALAVAGLAGLTWRFGVRHYRSTGS